MKVLLIFYLLEILSNSLPLSLYTRNTQHIAKGHKLDATIAIDRLKDNKPVSVFLS